MNVRWWVVVLFVLLSVAPSHAAPGRGAAELQGVLDRVNAEHLLVPGASAAVSAPGLGVDFEGASGTFALQSLRPLSPEDLYRIASVTKPFTAAAILRLAEDGRLSLNDTLGRWLPAAIVDRISVIDGVSYGPQITIRQLLNHTSGVFSHDEDPQFTATVAAVPFKRWSAEEQIELAIRNGPYFKPGERWRYSDTGYVMLGLILERVTRRSFAGALRALLPFRRLEMRSTYHELLEPQRAGNALAHQYVTALDFAGHDPSFDSWGGGGLVSTNHDLTSFIRALFHGRVFRHAATLRTMLTTVPTGSAAMYAYGLGIGRRTFDGTDCWMHSGFWSSIIAYCPSLDLGFAATTNQNKDEHNHTTHGILGEGIVHAVKAP